jgi:hypothetical protein
MALDRRLRLSAVLALTIIAAAALGATLLLRRQQPGPQQASLPTVLSPSSTTNEGQEGEDEEDEGDQALRKAEQMLPETGAPEDSAGLERSSPPAQGSTR